MLVSSERQRHFQGPPDRWAFPKENITYANYVIINVMKDVGREGGQATDACLKSLPLSLCPPLNPIVFTYGYHFEPLPTAHPAHATEYNKYKICFSDKNHVSSA